MNGEPYGPAAGGTPPGWAPPPGAAAPGGYANYPPPGPYPQYGAYGAKPAKRFGWGSLIAAFVLGGFLVFAGFVALMIIAVNIDDSVVSGTHPAGAEASSGAGVGDCLEGPPGSGSVVTDLAVVECSRQHGAEVFAVIEAPGGANRPSEAALSDYADGACPLAFRSYVGTKADDSMIGWSAVVPTRKAWSSGDHRVWCLANSVDHRNGYGSVRNSGE